MVPIRKTNREISLFIDQCPRVLFLRNAFSFLFSVYSLYSVVDYVYFVCFVSFAVLSVFCIFFVPFVFFVAILTFRLAQEGFGQAGIDRDDLPGREAQARTGGEIGGFGDGGWRDRDAQECTACIELR